MQCLPPARWYWCCLCALCAANLVNADNRVVVSATADASYTEKKYGEGKTKRETYVVMKGHYFAGTTIDGSIDKMTFRGILDYLAPKLALQQFLPAQKGESPDLLLVIHWGTTAPKTSSLEMMARTSAVTDTSNSVTTISQQLREATGTTTPFDALGSESDLVARFDQLEQLTGEMGAESATANIAQLLGYTKTLRTLQHDINPGETERTLKFDMAHERYFIIVKAYDLHVSTRGRSARAIWTLHLNMSSAGNNFRMAMAEMSAASVDYVGRSSIDVQTVRPKQREGHVDIGEAIIVGEQK